jgi:hypothetical protein
MQTCEEINEQEKFTVNLDDLARAAELKAGAYYYFDGETITCGTPPQNPPVPPGGDPPPDQDPPPPSAA